MFILIFMSVLMYSGLVNIHSYLTGHIPFLFISNQSVLLFTWVYKSRKLCPLEKNVTLIWGTTDMGYGGSVTGQCHWLCIPWMRSDLAWQNEQNNLNLHESKLEQLASGCKVPLFSHLYTFYLLLFFLMHSHSTSQNFPAYKLGFFCFPNDSAC